MKKLLFGGAGTGSPAGDAALAILRIVMGVFMILVHGWKKLQDPDSFLSGASMAKFPFPDLLGWGAIIAENFLALLIILGLATRISAAGLMGTMLGAALIVHASDPLNKKELGLVYAAICLLLICIGPGRFSVDRLISGSR